jgi:S1-C subfamily serine protease
MAQVSLCCPECAAVLKLANRPAEKSKVKCPKCAAVFVAAEHERTATAVKSRLEVAPKGPPPPREEEEELPRSRKRPAKMDVQNDPPRRKNANAAVSHLGLIIGLGVGGAVVAMAAVIAGLVLWFVVLPAKQATVAKGPEQPVAKIAEVPGVQPPNIPAPPPQIAPNPVPSPQPQAEPQPAPQPQAEPQPRPQPQPKTKRGPRPKGEPQPQPQAEPPPQPKAEPQPQPQAEPPPRPEPKPVAGPVDLDKDLLAKVTRATALVRVTLENQAATGSGFVVKSNGETGYIITNFHVIALEKEEPEPQQPAPGSRPRIPRIQFPPRRGPFGQPNPPQPKAQRKVTVVLQSGTPEAQSLSAEVVAVDPEADLAALRVTGARNLPPAIDASQDPPIAETQPVYIFGFPKKPGQVEPGDPTITIGKGTISGLRRDANNQLIDVHINGIINPGNSGGPVVDAQGRLVGIAVATVPGKQIGFAVPAVELHQMFKGRIASGFVVQLKAQAGQIVAIGETWVHDRRSSVRARDTLAVPLGPMPKGQAIPANEFLVMANVADPMLKVRGASAYFAVTDEVPEQPDAKGWTKLAKATPISLKLEDQLAIGTFKVPAGSVLDRSYAFQFSFINADGNTIYTQPHLVRLTFPKNTKSVTIQVTGIPDDPTRRYIEDTAPAAFGAKVVVKSRLKDGLVMEVDPVPDAKVIPAQIKFGTVTNVQGRTFEVKAGKIDLPVPTDDEVTRAVADLKGVNEKQVIAAADRLGKVYLSLPARRAEVAKALEPHITSKNIGVGGAALRGMMIWGGPENIPAIAAGTDNVFTRNLAMQCLARFKDPAAAAALAKCLTYGERQLAGAALKRIGPPAEEAVIPYLKNKDGWTVGEACGVLQVIGTPACIPALTEVANGDNVFNKASANNAIKAVNARGQAGK